MKLVDESTEKVIQISGTPEQAERAQSLLQGFILSSKSLSLSQTTYTQTGTVSNTIGFVKCLQHLCDSCSAEEDG